MLLIEAVNASLPWCADRREDQIGLIGMDERGKARPSGYILRSSQKGRESHPGRIDAIGYRESGSAVHPLRRKSRTSTAERRSGTA